MARPGHIRAVQRRGERLGRRVPVARPHLTPVGLAHMGGNGPDVRRFRGDDTPRAHWFTCTRLTSASTVTGVGSSERMQTLTLVSASVGMTTLFMPLKGAGALP